MSVKKQKTRTAREGARRRVLARQLAAEALASVSGGCTTFRQRANGVWYNDREI